jgi:hypothetical protein
MPLQSYNFRRGVDLPSWHWLTQYPTGASNPGTANAYDGARYVYWLIQSGATTAASTTQLWRFDTWTNGWQFLNSVPTNLFTGLDIEYDPVRNVLWIAEGNNTAVWRFYNLGTAAITLAGQTIQPFALSAAITPTLPANATTGASLVMPDDLSLAALPLDGTGRTASTLTAVPTTTVHTDTTAQMHAGMIGSYLRYTSGTNAGVARVITAVTMTSVTTIAFPATGAAGDAYVIETPGFTTALVATGGTTTTLVATGSGWPTNVYRDADVIIVAGTGAGQRRRIASNTGDTLTLAGATAGNARTGAFTTAPDATSTFRIVPSSDFLYLFVGTTTWYRADIVATTVAWTTFAAPAIPAAPGTGSNAIPSPVWAPFSIVLARGAATNAIYRLDIGLQAWATLPALWGQEALQSGGTVARVPGRPRLVVHATAQRLYLYDPITGVLDPIVSPPYAAPSSHEGKRLRWIRIDGVDWLYMMRAGGQELWRVPMEWL